MAYGEVWKAAILGTGPGGEAIVNTFHYGVLGASVGLVGADVALQVATVIVPALLNMVTSAYIFRNVSVLSVLGGSIGESAQSVFGGGVAGLHAGAPAPIDLCLIAKCSGDTLGRSNRGRKFISPVPAASIDTDGRFISYAAYDPLVFILVTTGITVAATPMDPVLWNHVTHLAVKVTHGQSAYLSGIQKRRRLRFPN